MAGIMVACGDDKKDEKKEAVTAETLDATLDKLAASLEDETPDNFIKIYNDIDKAYESASDEEKEALDEAYDKWEKENREEAMKIRIAAEELEREGEL